MTCGMMAKTKTCQMSCSAILQVMELQTDSEMKSMTTLMSLILKNVTNPIFHYMIHYTIIIQQISCVCFYCLFFI